MLLLKCLCIYLAPSWLMSTLFEEVEASVSSKSEVILLYTSMLGVCVVIVLQQECGWLLLLVLVWAHCVGCR